MTNYEIAIRNYQNVAKILARHGIEMTDAGKYEGTAYTIKTANQPAKNTVEVTLPIDARDYNDKYGDSDALQKKIVRAADAFEPSAYDANEQGYCSSFRSERYKKIYAPFAKELNLAANELSEVYSIPRNIKMLSIDASVREWFEESRILSAQDNPAQYLDENLTFRSLERKYNINIDKLTGGNRYPNDKDFSKGQHARISAIIQATTYARRNRIWRGNDAWRIVTNYYTGNK